MFEYASTDHKPKQGKQIDDDMNADPHLYQPMVMGPDTIRLNQAQGI